MKNSDNALRNASPPLMHSSMTISRMNSLLRYISANDAAKGTRPSRALGGGSGTRVTTRTVSSGNRITTGQV